MIYLDNAATTPVCPQAAQAVMHTLREEFGNPSARYPLGTQAAQTLKAHRAAVAQALGCDSGEVFFTSCGTEGDNWAIFSGVDKQKRRGRHIITTAIEHAAVLEPVRALAAQGYEITYLQPDRTGNILLSDLEAALRPDTILVSMMLVNNELGTVLPVKEAAAAIRRSGAPALLHCDAVQGFLKIPFTPKALGVDLLTVSGHKIGAPKGVGALYIKNGLKLSPLLRGGGQEGGLRSGTEATAQIAGFAAACQAGFQDRQAHMDHMAALKEYALKRLTAQVPELTPIGQGTAPHILCLSLPGYKSEVLVRVLGDMGVCVSAGSACHRGKPSHVLAAMNLNKAERDGAFRVSFSPENTQADVDALATALKEAKEKLFPSLS